MKPSLPLSSLEKLKPFAYVNLNEENTQAIKDLVEKDKGWYNLLFEAEKNGLAPIVYHHLKALELELKERDHHLLKTLAFRHIKASETRYDALQAFDTLFKEQNISYVAMKGIAMAPLIYPQASMRPMGDMDFLIDPKDSEKVRNIMLELDYAMAAEQKGFMKNHHHLPAAEKKVRGMNVAVEWHTSAIGRDYKHDLVMADSKDKDLMQVNWNEVEYYTFDFITLLKQLCHNIAGVEYHIRLINVVDIYQLLVMNLDKLSATNLKKDDFFVYNVIQCLHMYLPLPEPLREYFDADFIEQHSKDGAGISMKPVSHVFSKGRKLKDKFTGLFCPSEWWMHMFYSQPIDKSLLFIRCIKHPLQLIVWLGQRIIHRGED